MKGFANHYSIMQNLEIKNNLIFHVLRHLMNVFNYLLIHFSFNYSSQHITVHTHWYENIFRNQNRIKGIDTKMHRACPQRRYRLSNIQPNGVVRESRHCSLAVFKRNQTPSQDERFPWGMSEASIVRWVLGICCLFLLFPGNKGGLCNRILSRTIHLH